MQDYIVMPKKQIKDRVLTFTHEEVALLQHALSIADRQYQKLFESASELNNLSPEELKKLKFAANSYYHKANQFNNLSVAIANGNMDV